MLGLNLVLDYQNKGCQDFSVHTSVNVHKTVLIERLL